MSLTINSNSAASYSALSMKRANNLLTKSLQRLSSGQRITSASDDAGGLAVGMKLKSSILRGAASQQNTQNGISFLQMQDGVMKTAGKILDRMSELKSFSNDITKNESDRETYNHEFHELQKELNSLKAQKFNGVSLFASVEMDGSLGIDTSDDGMGEKIRLRRTGLFENLKSKFGADSELNTGSHGEYRQLIGDFFRDGGFTAPNPGYTSRNYGKNQVVYKEGADDASTGYFMALKDLMPGTKIIDSGTASSNWIRIADMLGQGFGEAFPNADVFDPFSSKRNAKGRSVSYLQGDVVKVPAHWDSPGSYYYMKAQTDIPYGKTLAEIYAEDQVGPGKFFDYIGNALPKADGTLIPTTDFIRQNKDYPDPSLYNPEDASSFMNLLDHHGAAAGFTPGFIRVAVENDPYLNGSTTSTVVSGVTSSVNQLDTVSVSAVEGADDLYSVFKPTGDWGIQAWDPNRDFEAGSLVWDTSTGVGQIYELGDSFKGSYAGQTASVGDVFLHEGDWYKAEVDGVTTEPSVDNSSDWTLIDDPLSAEEMITENRTEEFQNLSNTSLWVRTHHGHLVGKTIKTDYERGDNIQFQGKSYIYTSNLSSSEFKYNPDQNGVTEFDQLLAAGAIVEAPLYVDTRGGGGAPNGNPDIFYRPNQSLEFVDRLDNTGIVRTNSIERRSDSAMFPGDMIFNSQDDQFYGGLNAGNDGIYGTADDFYSTATSSAAAMAGGHVDADMDNNKDLLDVSNGLEDFSVADFVDYIQTLANMRAINGGTMSRLNYTSDILDENEINLEAATSRILDADMAREATMMARQNVLLQASASMVTQANALSGIVLSLLQ